MILANTRVMILANTRVMILANTRVNDTSQQCLVIKKTINYLLIK